LAHKMWNIRALRRSSNHTVFESNSIDYGFTPVKGGHVEHLNTVFNVTAFHCNDRRINHLRNCLIARST